MHQLNEGEDFFQKLEQRMRVLSPPVQLGFKRDRWLIGLAVLGVGLALVPWDRFIPPNMAVWLTLSGTVLQLIGVILIAYRQARDTVPDFIDAKRKFAAELDEHFAERERVLAWLRSIPIQVRLSRLVYAEARLEAIHTRYPMVFGAVDRLGVLPVLVGVFIQLQALKSVSGPAMFLGIAIVALYLMSLWMIRYRGQLEGYVRVLRTVDQPVSEARQ